MFISNSRRQKLCLTLLACVQCAVLICTGCANNAPTNGVNTNATNTATPPTNKSATNEKATATPETSPAPPGADQFSIDQAKLQMATDRDYARQYVQIAKQSLAGKPELKTVEDSYRDLTSVYNGWLTVVKIAVATGDKKFDKGTANKQKAKEAAQKTEAFVSLVKAKTAASGGQKIAFGVLVSALIDAGVKIWKAHKQIQAEQREAVAGYIEKALKWETWEEIPAGAAAAASPTQAPTKPSPSPH